VPFLSPAKLLVILVVGVVVLGPDRLPRVARQLGALWHDLGRMRARLESDVRDAFPDLPSTELIHRAARSPLSLLDTLAEGGSPPVEPTLGVVVGSAVPGPSAPASAAADTLRGADPAPGGRSPRIPSIPWDDPGLN
jgi:Sec-independent protein translocase protein TatA